MRGRHGPGAGPWGLPPFRPLPPFFGGRAQTIAARYWPQASLSHPEQRHAVPLPDGDELVLLESRPPGWREGGRIAVLVHGLTGCSGSNYMVRLARRLVGRGVLVLRLNLRGCGPGFGRARKPYHSGRSEDTRAVLGWVNQAFPASPVTQIGFSLGGNITLKMAGEDGAAPAGGLDSVVAVSPPIRLEPSARKLGRAENRIFERYFVRELRGELARRHRHYGEEEPRLPRRLTLFDLDDLYTAPRCGFRDARHYYATCSSEPLLPAIQVPTLLLASLDDPVLDTESFRELDARRPGSAIDLVLTERGGHVGFLGAGRFGLPVRWMDELVLKWMEEAGLISAKISD